MTRVRGVFGLAMAAVGVVLAVGHFFSTDASASAHSSEKAPVVKRLAHVPTRLAVRPVGGKPANQTGPPVATVPHPLAQSDETAHLVQALRKAWSNRPSVESRRAAPTPASLPQARAGDPAAMQRAFDGMVVDVEWKRLIKGKLVHERQRLQRRGVHVANVECRVAACRFEFVFSGRAAERRRKRLQNGQRVRATEKTLVHSWADEESGVRTVVFLARSGTLPLG